MCFSSAPLLLPDHDAPDKKQLLKCVKAVRPACVVRPRPATASLSQKKDMILAISIRTTKGWWFVTSQPNVGYSIDGCDYYVASGYSPPANPNVNPVYSFLLAVPCQLGGTTITPGCKAQLFPTGNTHIEIFIQPQNWDTQFCTNAFTIVSQAQASWYGSQQCTNLETWFTTPHGGGLQAGFFTPFLTILFGIILFLIGLGINVQAGGSIFGSGTQFGAGVNAQGTRLAQVLGLALIAYTPLYSEFSTWFTSGILPNGLDGDIIAISSGSGIIALIVTAVFFVGVFWQTMTIEGG